MLFRSLQADDAEFYRYVRRCALDEVPQFVGPLAEREAAMEVDELRRQLAAYPCQGVHVFGCFMNGEGAAVAAMTRKLDPKYAHKLFLWGMFVLSPYRRHSIGRHFVAHLVGFARQQVGVQFITLQVTTTNAPARALADARQAGIDDRARSRRWLAAGGGFVPAGGQRQLGELSRPSL